MEGKAVHFAAIGEGHIHDTFRVDTDAPGCTVYVLQMINRQVFPDVPALMENLQRVTRHICKNKQGGASSGRITDLILVPTFNETFYLRDHASNYWRCFRYCHHLPVDEQKVSTALAYEAGKLLGEFQQLLSDFEAPALHEVIPGFHDLNKRLKAFREAVERASALRRENAKEEIHHIRHLEDEMLIVHRLGEEGIIPLRITHNDTKFNNFLFDENGRALCLIDLDTVMNGYIFYDYGDAIRTLANTCSEDHPILKSVGFDHQLFYHFTEGYWKTAKAFLSATEISLLAASPAIMTYTMAVRFLTDFLQDDVYFKIRYPEHNLQRAKNQLELLRHIYAAKAEMEKSIAEITNG